MQNEVIKVAGNIDNVYGNKVNWNMELLNISPERTLSNPVITNRLEQGNTGAQFIKNSFQVINTKTNEPINEENYDIIFEGNTFTIQFKNYTAMAPIKVSYSTISLLSGPISNETTVEAEDFSNVPMFFKKEMQQYHQSLQWDLDQGLQRLARLKSQKWMKTILRRN